ncbi:MAG TPA: DUF3499 domain-containing protein [Candidatus Nanopelagicaceae bacterium]
MRTQHRTSRTCSRASCTLPASKTLTYIYADSTAVLGPLAMYAEPHSYDLCPAHSEKLTVPNGWSVTKSEPESELAGPSEDDLMAIANAVREVGSQQGPVPPSVPSQPELGRRGHLRGLPSN